jgi:hypothetical protein
MRYPDTPVRLEPNEVGGLAFDDPYQWLEEDGEDVLAWQAAQDELARSWIHGWPHHGALAARVGELVEQMETEEPLLLAADAAPYDQVDEETALLQEEERQYHAEVVEGIQEVLGSAKADRQAHLEEQKNSASGVWGVMHPYSAWEQIRSPWFVLICLFTGKCPFFSPFYAAKF